MSMTIPTSSTFRPIYTRGEEAGDTIHFENISTQETSRGCCFVDKVASLRDRIKNYLPSKSKDDTSQKDTLLENVEVDFSYDNTPKSKCNNSKCKKIAGCSIVGTIISVGVGLGIYYGLRNSSPNSNLTSNMTSLSSPQTTPLMNYPNSTSVQKSSVESIAITNKAIDSYGNIISKFLEYTEDQLANHDLFSKINPIFADNFHKSLTVLHNLLILALDDKELATSYKDEFVSLTIDREYMISMNQGPLINKGDKIKPHEIYRDFVVNKLKKKLHDSISEIKDMQVIHDHIKDDKEQRDKFNQITGFKDNVIKEITDLSSGTVNDFSIKTVESYDSSYQQDIDTGSANVELLDKKFDFVLDKVIKSSYQTLIYAQNRSEDINDFIDKTIEEDFYELFKASQDIEKARIDLETLKHLDTRPFIAESQMKAIEKLITEGSLNDFFTEEKKQQIIDNQNKTLQAVNREITHENQEVSTTIKIDSAFTKENQESLSNAISDLSTHVKENLQLLHPYDEDLFINTTTRFCLTLKEKIYKDIKANYSEFVPNNPQKIEAIRKSSTEAVSNFIKSLVQKII